MRDCPFAETCSRMGGICQCAEDYAELQAENLAAADLDPDWPAVYE